MGVSFVKSVHRLESFKIHLSNVKSKYDFSRATAIHFLDVSISLAHHKYYYLHD